MPSARIIGTGHYVPSRVVTNHELTELCNTSDEWIRKRTGIETRHFIEPGQTTSELGTYAAERALEAAGRAKADVDCVIFATLSPDYLFPGCGCLLQSRLGLNHVPAFDVRNQCSGFLYGLQMANAFIRSGAYETVGLDLTPNGRDVSVLFGDGAGAVLLEACDDPERGVIDVRLGADGSHYDDLWCEGPSSARHPVRVTAEMLDEGVQFPKMQGRKVFKHAVSRMRTGMQEILAQNGLTKDDLALLIPHQANLRISEMVERMLKVEAGVVFNNIQKVGNTTAASIPIALDECVRGERLGDGDLLGMVAFGSGFTWGSALIRW